MKLSHDLKYRGLIYQVTSPDLLDILDGSDPSSTQELTCYAGFDPTAASLHLGNLMQIQLLRRLQLAGIQVIALAGGGTGLIGDPSGKASERPMMSLDAHRANLERITLQLGNLLDLSRGTATVLDNSEWLVPLKLVDFLRDIGKHFTVSQMTAKESVKSRLGRPDQGMSFTEFTYMLLQAYDFLHLFDNYNCRLQTGASDQWGNITMGVELIGRVRKTTAYGLTTPLLLRADGSKFGKTEDGTIWLDPALTSPYQMYQYLVRVEDAEVVSYLKLLTFLTHEDIDALEEATRTRPEKREAQTVLAREICTIVHGEDRAHRAELSSSAIFSEKVRALDEQAFTEVFADTPHTIVSRAALDGNGYDIVDALVITGLVPSKGRARANLEQGGVYLNNKRVHAPGGSITEDDLIHGRFALVRRGKKDYHILEFL
ncbi:MAG: tyrosine--tRNA ligase [Actinobacteria bacterium]|jgi:tyrosyl-tRNA synthetase|nr:tyrosine--tRNA ligase [Actinomycetota bacterium]